jgi:hypothetical protein
MQIMLIQKRKPVPCFDFSAAVPSHDSTPHTVILVAVVSSPSPLFSLLSTRLSVKKRLFIAPSDATSGHHVSGSVATAATAAAGEAGDDDVEDGDDAVDDGGQHGPDAVDDGHQAVADGAEDGFELEFKEVSVWIS